VITDVDRQHKDDQVDDGMTDFHGVLLETVVRPLARPFTSSGR
jgi:hypothetical protein